MREYTDDLVALVDSLESPPLVVGLSLGGLLAQLVATRTLHAGVVAACPIPPAQIAPKTAARYHRGTYVQIPCADHLVFSGPAVPTTMGHIDDWIARNQVLTIA